MHVRGFLAVGMSLIVTPLQTQAAVNPSNLIDLLLLVGREALLGLALGLAVLILFTGLQLTGQVIGQISGMSLADVFNPTYEADVSIFSQLLDVIAIAAFLAIGGHRQVLEALLDTFQARPPGSGEFPVGVAATLVELLGESFVVGRAGRRARHGRPAHVGADPRPHQPYTAATERDRNRLQSQQPHYAGGPQRLRRRHCRRPGVSRRRHDGAGT